MKTPKPSSPGIPQHDYRLALQGALSWLGDRYLLAEPLNRRRDSHQQPLGDSDRSQSLEAQTGAMA